MKPKTVVLFATFLFLLVAAPPARVDAGDGEQISLEKELGVFLNYFAEDALCTVCGAAVDRVATYFRGTNGKVLDMVADAGAVTIAAEGLCHALDVTGVLKLAKSHKITLDVCIGMARSYGSLIAHILPHTNPKTVCMLAGFCRNNTVEYGKSYEDIVELPVSQWSAPTSLSPASATFAQISDIHLDSMYAPNSPMNCGRPTCCRAEYEGDKEIGVPKIPCGPFGAVTCDTPHLTTLKLLEATAAKKPGFVICTGDYADHVLWRQSFEVNQRPMLEFSAMAKTALNGIPFFPIFGNHDTYPQGLFAGPAGDEENLIPEFNDTWIYETAVKAWITDNKFLPVECKETILAGGYYTALVPQSKLRIVALNSMLGSYKNYALLTRDMSKADPSGQLAWLKRTLSQASNANEKVLLLGHIPPTKDFFEGYIVRLTAILDQFSGTVLASFHGHTHNDTFYVRRDMADGERPTGVGFVAPAATGYRVHNPAYRLYHYDSSSLALLDYDQYEMDLDIANQRGAVNLQSFVHTYSFRATYGVPDLSPQWMQRLVGRLASNDVQMQTYWKNIDSALAVGDCDEQCQRNALCEMTASTPAQMRTCVKKENILSWLFRNIYTTIASIFGFGAVVGTGGFFMRRRRMMMRQARSRNMESKMRFRTKTSESGATELAASRSDCQSDKCELPSPSHGPGGAPQRGSPRVHGSPRMVAKVSDSPASTLRAITPHKASDSLYGPRSPAVPQRGSNCASPRLEDRSRSPRQKTSDSVPYTKPRGPAPPSDAVPATSGARRSSPMAAHYAMPTRSKSPAASIPEQA